MCAEYLLLLQIVIGKDIHILLSTESTLPQMLKLKKKPSIFGLQNIQMFNLLLNLIKNAE